MIEQVKVRSISSTSMPTSSLYLVGPVLPPEDLGFLCSEYQSAHGVAGEVAVKDLLPKRVCV